MTLYPSKIAKRCDAKRRGKANLIKKLIEKFAPEINYQDEIVSPTEDMTLETMIGLFRMRPRVMVYARGRDALTGERMDDCDIITDDLYGEYHGDADVIVLLPRSMYSTQTEYILTYIHELAHSSFVSKRLRKLNKNGYMIRRFDEEAAATMVEFMAVAYCGTQADVASDISGHDFFCRDARKVIADRQNEAEFFFRNCSEREIQNTVRFAVESFKYFAGKGRWEH